MNYIELEIGGRKRGFRFGLGCIGELIDVLNIRVEEIEGYISRNPIKAIPAAFYCAAKCHAEDTETQLDFTRNDMSDWIYELEGSFSNKKVEKLMDAMRTSFDKYSQNGQEVEAAKKK